MSQLTKTVEQIFSVYDTNNNNYLEEQEIMWLLIDGARSVGKSCLIPEDLQDFINLVDRNRDGKVSKRELVGFFKMFVPEEQIQGQTTQQKPVQKNDYTNNNNNNNK